MSDSADTITVISDNAAPNSERKDLSFPPLSCQLFSSTLTCLVGPHRSQLRDYLLMLAGIYAPISGQVEVFGKDVSELEQLQWRKLRCQIGYFSGIAPLQSVQNALMNVMIPALYHTSMSFQEAMRKAKILLTELSCDFEFSVFPARLDSFQKLQISLARALILDPELLILDVPFNDLGALEREKMGKILGRFQQSRTVCMIGGLQYPHFLADYAHQIIFISEHKIVHFGGWKSFMQAKDADVQELLSLL